MSSLQRATIALTLVATVLTGIAAARTAGDGAFADSLEKARQEMGLPGFAIAVVQNDKIVFSRGFGLRSAEKNLPVTPDTLFAIGSCSKAFTAMVCAMADDEGRLRLDDSPRKALPDFTLQDADALEKITIRDMLCHRSGLGETDLAWYTGVLDRDEVIRVAGIAKPTAPFRSKWQYQNVMYSAAGEAAARAFETTYEQLITDRVLRPLGMKRSSLTVGEMQQAEDFAQGYSYDPITKETRPVPMRDLSSIAPAGAINSSVNDMTQWVRLMLSGGEFDGKRLVSAERFADLLKPEIEAMPGASYTLGWLAHQWHGVETFEHGGGIDGFNAYVVIVPEKKLGYVLLTNVTSSTINNTVRELVWNRFVEPSAAPDPEPAGNPATQPGVDPQQVVGKYGMMEIVFRDDQLYAIAPAQPPYRLEAVGDNRYRLANAPPGFFITFRETDSGREIFLEQPQGNFTFAREPSPEEAARAAAEYNGPNKDLLGTYSTEGFSMDIVVRGAKVAAIVAGQPPYTLVEKEKDVFALEPLPESFELMIRRDVDGNVTGAFLKQPRPQPDMELKRAATTDGAVHVDEIIDRAVRAAGGEAALRAGRTLSMSFELGLENQGLSGRGSITLRAPDFATRTVEFVALGRPIGTTTETFDGKSGSVRGSFLPASPLTQDQLAEARAITDFHGPAGWREQFKSITFKGKSKVGDEECSILELKPEAGPTVNVYISEASGHVLRRDFPRAGDRGTGQVVELFSDFREVDGIKLPFRVVQTSAELGRVVQTVTEAKAE